MAIVLHEPSKGALKPDSSRKDFQASGLSARENAGSALSTVKRE